jgi:hypothetical protein
MNYGKYIWVVLTLDLMIVHEFKETQRPPPMGLNQCNLANTVTCGTVRWSIYFWSTSEGWLLGLVNIFGSNPRMRSGDQAR